MNAETMESHDAVAGQVERPVRPGAGASLPAPRLQLRWAEADDGDTHYQWHCHYELVLPLREPDIRREVYDDDGMQTGEVSELVVPLNPPTRRGGGGEPCRAQDGTSYCDAPYRDGAHAGWDAAALGGLPVYVIDVQGVPFLKA
jgi:hypothetical protein